jgi:hypothetical protein
MIMYFIDFEAALTGSNFSLPTEMTIAMYTLRGGFIRPPLHFFIHPGLICEPHVFSAMRVTMFTPPTGIPFGNFALARYDYDIIWQEITEYMPANSFIVAKAPRTEYQCLEWLACRAGTANPYVRIYDYIEFFPILATLCGRELPFARRLELQRRHKLYEFYDTRCEYHQMLMRLDQQQPDGEDGHHYHCSRGEVMSYAYALNYAINSEFYTLLKAERLPEQEPILVDVDQTSENDDSDDDTSG